MGEVVQIRPVEPESVSVAPAVNKGRWHVLYVRRHGGQPPKYQVLAEAANRDWAVYLARLVAQDRQLPYEPEVPR